MLALVIAVATITLTAEHAKAESNVAKAEEYTRKACELVWMDAAPFRIEQCTRRAMAALSEHNQLRDNELKRLLLDTEGELETCEAQLTERQDREAGDPSLTAKRRERPRWR